MSVPKFKASTPVCKTSAPSNRTVSLQHLDNFDRRSQKWPIDGCLHVVVSGSWSSFWLFYSMKLVVLVACPSNGSSHPGGTCGRPVCWQDRPCDACCLHFMGQYVRFCLFWDKSMQRHEPISQKELKSRHPHHPTVFLFVASATACGRTFGDPYLVMFKFKTCEFEALSQEHL